ncbi:MAG TPA: tetratricopeptide repeat protein, partial [Candidatus Acidoferrales bacterium]|nr:tetratricopeptide repeat protein [Candidatus Acidoferrales bacterium]
MSPTRLSRREGWALGYPRSSQRIRGRVNQHEWESAPVDASTALEWLHAFGVDACDLDDRSQVEHVLSLVPIAQRNADPACLAVRAALKRYDGHVDKALELYQRALAAAEGDTRLEAQIRENLAILRILRKEMSEAEEVLARALAIAPDDARLLAIRAMLRGQRRDKRALED